jgi:hypothetical protein
MSREIVLNGSRIPEPGSLEHKVTEGINRAYGLEDVDTTQPKYRKLWVEYFNPFGEFYGAMVPNWLMRRKEVSPGAKLCYGKLCQFNGKNGKCFPGRELLAKELGCSPRSVTRYVKELQKWNLLDVIRVGKRCTNRYLFHRHKWMGDWRDYDDDQKEEEYEE